MLRKNYVRPIAAVLAAATLFSGCNANGNIKSSGSDSSETTQNTTESTTEESETETTGTFNHGHSISEASSYRHDEINRSSDVLTNRYQAQEYLENCVELPGPDFKFVLTETSENDPGAYMWYEFTLSYKDILVMNGEFRVITFTDGTLCEGNPAVFTCTFADPNDVISQDDALKIYAEEYQDDRDYKYLDSIYYASSKGNRECNIVYKYKYDCGKFDENQTILLNAKTGEMIGCWPDAID